MNKQLFDKGRIYIGYDTAEQEELSRGRYNFALRYIRSSDVVLDCACGSGYGSEILSQKVQEVYGVDNDVDAIDYASIHYGNPRISFRYSDISQRLDFPDELFDVVVSIETLEHVKEHNKMMSEFQRVLKSNGLLVLSTVEHHVYSELGGIRNKFHVGELTKRELVGLVGRYFQPMGLYGQTRYKPLPIYRKMLHKLWVGGLVTLAEIDRLGLRHRFNHNKTIGKINESFSTQGVTDFTKVGFDETNEYYQLLVVAKKI